MFVNLLITFIMVMNYGFSMKGKNTFWKDGLITVVLIFAYTKWQTTEKNIWKGNATHYPVEAFLEAKIWNGKSFWDAEQDIEWVDD